MWATVDKCHAAQLPSSSLFYSSSGAIWGGSLMWQLYHMHFVAHWALCARLGDARFVPFCSPPWTANNTEAHSSKVQAFYSQKLEEGLSPRSVILIHAVLHQALENAVKWGLVPRNV